MKLGNETEDKTKLTSGFSLLEHGRSNACDVAKGGS